MNIQIQGSIVPKARPRFSKGVSYLPTKYKEWKEQAIAQLIAFVPLISIPIPVSRCKVEIYLVGKHPRRGDLDNLAGAVLDALVQAHILADDRISVVNHLVVSHLPSNLPPFVDIFISPN